MVEGKPMIDYWTYDIECYPNCFTCALERYSDRGKFFFEISFRRDDTRAFIEFLDELNRFENAAMVGFNNFGFDWPIVNDFWKSLGRRGYVGAYEMCQSIIEGDGFEHTVWDPKIQQIDLYKLNHFDNAQRRTSLKQVEFNMRVPSLRDLPFEPGTVLTSEQIDVLIHYNMHGDVVNTREFLTECIPAIEFRETFGAEWLNYNDTKLGKKFFINSLQDAGVTCFVDKQPMQTMRPTMDLKDALLPYVRFEHPEFQRIHKHFYDQTITETKGVFSGLDCTVDGFKYVFGLGGIHGSVSPQTVIATDSYMIEDWDVTSYYPNIAIANRLYPEHLTEKFCDIYKDLFEQRTQHKKGTPMNAALKLALNGVYGDSNSKYSPFYDPLYTMSITINGQLLLCMLAEWLSKVDSLQMIQINTDGVSIRYHRDHYAQVHQICESWERMTQLNLEDVEYSHMHIRDVNNYIGVYPDGKHKLKGAYLIERQHHQNHSALVVAKAAEMVLTQGMSVEAAVQSHKNIFDYCLFVKAPQLEIDEVNVQRRSRYYVSTTGGTLRSIKPPPKGMVTGDFKKKQGVTKLGYALENHTGIHNPAIHTKNESRYGSLISEVEKGWKVTMANDIMTCCNPINYEYYYDRVRKLVEPVI
jgi:hypothetical protein